MGAQEKSQQITAYHCREIALRSGEYGIRAIRNSIVCAFLSSLFISIFFFFLIVNNGIISVLGNRSFFRRIEKNRFFKYVNGNK